MSLKAVLFDRDGVLNEDEAYVGTWERFRWRHGAREAVRILNEAGILAIVVTNQSGIARGYFRHDEFLKLTDQMQRSLQEIGAHVDAVFYCPYLHHDGTCIHDLRKPAPGMVLYAMRTFQLNPDECFLLGDMDRDIQSAQAAGVEAALVDPQVPLDQLVSQLIGEF